MFFYEDFRPSEVINRPQRNFKEDPPGETSKELQMPGSIEKKPADGSAFSNSLKSISPPEGSTAKAEGARISPSNIFPLPKSKAAINRGRSARRSQIMRCSPFKNSLSNVTKKRRAKDSTGQKRSSRMGLLLDSHRVQERKRRKRRIFLVQDAMRNMKTQLNKTAYNA